MSQLNDDEEPWADYKIIQIGVPQQLFDKLAKTYSCSPKASRKLRDSPQLFWGDLPRIFEIDEFLDNEPAASLRQYVAAYILGQMDLKERKRANNNIKQ